MDLRSLIADVGRRFNESKKKKKDQPKVEQSLLQDIHNRFTSFVSEQSKQQPLHKITRTIQELPTIAQSQVDAVGTRYKSFLDSQQSKIDEVGKRYEAFKTKADQFGYDYNPTNRDPKAKINTMPVLGDIRRFTYDHIVTPEQKEFEVLKARKKKGESLTPQEQAKYQEYEMNYARDMAMNSVNGIGTVGKVGKPALTKLQQEAIKKLPNIMYDFGDDVVKEADNFINNAKNASPEWKAMFKDWVNTRASSYFAGVRKKLDFSDLDSEGIMGIFKFQAGDKSGRFADVKKYFDETYQQLQKAGVQFNYKQDYLPQLWLNSADEVQEKLGKTLTQRPSFSLESFIKDYQTGIANDLTPRFTKISDLVGWYQKKVTKTLADQKFFNYLKDKGIITTEAKEWYKQLSTDHFPAEKIKIGNEIKSNPYYAPREIADAIENYLQDSDGLVSSFATFATKVKNMGMSAGVPHTGINFHGWNIFLRSVMASNNPLGAMYRSGSWMLNPRSAQQFVMKNLEDAEFFVKNGLTVSNTDYGLSESLKRVQVDNLGGKVAGKFETWFGDPLFKKIIPAIKIQYTRALYDDLLKSMPEDKAIKSAVQSANNIFGGLNLDEMMRSKHTQNVFRSIIFAPDWSESTIRTGAGIVKGIVTRSPEYRAYRVFARNMVFAYVSANVLNYAMSGHFMFQNEKGRKFQLDTGTYANDGKKRYFRLFGTAIDFARLPFEIVEGLASGDSNKFITTFTNRLSLPAGSIAHLVTNRDYALKPIYGTDQYGNDIPLGQSVAGVTNEVLRGVGVPTQVMAGIDYVSGRSNGEEALSRAFEVPTAYSGGAYSKTAKAKKELFESLGYKGEALAQKLKETENTRFSVGDEVQEKSLIDHIGEKFSSFFGGKADSQLEAIKDKPELDPLHKAFLEGKEKGKKNARIRELFSMELPRPEMEKVLKEENLGTYEEAQLVLWRSEEVGVRNGERGRLIMQTLEDLDEEDKIKTLEYLAENKVLTSDVIAVWLDDGDITQEEADALKDLIKKADGTYKPKTAKGRKGATTVKSNGSVPTIKVPKFASNTVSSPARKTAYKQVKPIKVSPHVPQIRRSPMPEPTQNFKPYQARLRV